MPQSLGIHQYRPFPNLPSGVVSNQNVNLNNYYNWLDYDFDTNTGGSLDLPQWISETGETYDSYKMIEVTAYRAKGYGSFGSFEYYFGAAEIIPVPDGTEFIFGTIPTFLEPYRTSLPEPSAPAGSFDVFFFRPYKAEFLRNTRVNYMSLVKGFEGDSRTIPELPIITSGADKTIRLAYYARNHLEPIPDLTSIYWNVKDIELTANIPAQLPIKNCVLGTLVCSDSSVKALIQALPTQSGKYSYSDLFPENIASLMTYWNGISPNTNTNIIRKLAANNNAWNNADLSGNVDLNVDINHPMFAVDNARAISNHITTQSDGSYGELNMDSPRLIELHTALNAADYLLEVAEVPEKFNPPEPAIPAKHRLDWYIKHAEKLISIWKTFGEDDYVTWFNDAHNPPIKEDRVSTLRWYIENTARVLGIRVDGGANIDNAKEKDLYQPKTINNPTLGLPTTGGKYNSYGMSCFGTIGMVIPHLPTTYGTNGSATQLFDVVHDIPQMQMAILRQMDVSLSIQHGSEIRVRGLDGKVHAYPNQLAVNLECLQRLEKISYLSERNLLIGTVAGNEIRELFSGIGVPVTQKFMPLRDPNISKKVLSIPYFGHQKNKPSTAQMLTTVHVNLAVINGVLMPKKQPSKGDVFNPFKRFAPPK